eukprot:4676006-Alexandrium_andersonii.AAC.1
MRELTQVSRRRDRRRGGKRTSRSVQASGMVPLVPGTAAAAAAAATATSSSPGAIVANGMSR